MTTRSSRATRKIRSGKKAGKRVTRKNRLHKRKNQKKTVMHRGGGKDPVDFEAVSIAKISFVPSNDEVVELIAQAKKAEKTRNALALGTDIDKTPWRSVKLLSKLYFLPDKYGLCPDSLNPDDTILAKLGRGDIGLGDGLGDGPLRVINDRNMPLGSTSCGPNGVLVECNKEEYGLNRMNLFYDSVEKTTALLNDYIQFRDDNLKDIFKMFVEYINKCIESGFKLDPTKPNSELLAVELQNDYTNVRDMFNLVLTQSKSKSLSDCGIGVVSFCQTWLRNGSDVGDAQFSVMSPHFQTRFFVNSIDALKSFKVTDVQIASYENIIAHFDDIMSKEYGLDGGGPAFINLDGLYDNITHTNNQSRMNLENKKRLFKNRFVRYNA